MAADYVEVQPSVLAARRAREKSWKDQSDFEMQVLKPYLEVFNAAPHEWLSLIESRSKVIMTTNTSLQKQLSATEKAVQQLQHQYSLRSQEWEMMQGKFRGSKEGQKDGEKQLCELREARVAEERRLQEQCLLLRDKHYGLIDRQRILEAQRREDDRKVRMNQELLEELAFMQAKLELKKAEHEFDQDLPGAAGESEAMDAEVDITITDIMCRPIREDLEMERNLDPPRRQGSMMSVDPQGVGASRPETPSSLRDHILDSARPISPRDQSMFVDMPLRSPVPLGRATPPHRATPTPPLRRMSPTPPPGGMSPSHRATPPRRTPTPSGMRTSPPPRSTPTPVASPGEEACSNCGHILFGDSVSCRKCGTKR